MYFDISLLSLYIIQTILDFAQILQIWFQGMLRKFVQMGTKASIECVRIEYKPHLPLCVIPVENSI